MVQTDQDIVVRCQCGDKDAFRLLVQTYQRMIFSLALKMLGDDDEAKDVVQDTFIKVWQSIERYDRERNFVTWLYTIASRLCLDRLKMMKRVLPLPEDESVLRDMSAEVNGLHRLENREWIAVVRVLAEGLGEKQRLVFTLCQLEGLTSAEVEVITGLNATQVKSNLYVARQMICKRLKRLGYE